MNPKPLVSIIVEALVKLFLAASLTWYEIILIYYQLSRRKCNFLNNFVTDRDDLRKPLSR